MDIDIDTDSDNYSSEFSHVMGFIRCRIDWLWYEWLIFWSDHYRLAWSGYGYGWFAILIHIAWIGLIDGLWDDPATTCCPFAVANNSGLILGCELLRGQGFPATFKSSGATAKLPEERIEIPAPWLTVTATATIVFGCAVTVVTWLQLQLHETELTELDLTWTLNCSCKNSWTWNLNL